MNAKLEDSSHYAIFIKIETKLKTIRTEQPGIRCMSEVQPMTAWKGPRTAKADIDARGQLSRNECNQAVVRD